MTEEKTCQNEDNTTNDTCACSANLTTCDSCGAELELTQLTQEEEETFSLILSMNDVDDPENYTFTHRRCTGCGGITTTAHGKEKVVQ